MEDIEKKYEDKRLKNALAYSAQIKAFYDRLIQQFTQILGSYRYSDSVAQAQSVWFNNGVVKEGITQCLNKSSQELEQIIQKAVVTDWELAESKQDAILMKVLTASTVVSGGLAVYDLFNRVRPEFDAVVLISGSANNIQNTSKTIVTLADVVSAPRNTEALTAFTKRRIDGLNLSERVWKITEDNKNMIEELLANSILEGQSAPQTASIIKEYLLNGPNRIFRRVRNKVTGELEMSASAKVFRSGGRGVYKSSHQNALRLSITEANISFHTANHNRRLKNNMVVGFEVRTSKTNHPIADVCDHLAGRYPKEFKFVSWHPMCRCHAVDIRLSDDEFDNYLQSILNGGDFDLDSINTVKVVPDGFNTWIRDNTERAKGWANQPYFIRDNFEGGKIDGGLSFKG